ncbi:sigma-70 family RNA polymerase sigma factor [Micromonospora sp. IBHARD004]|uniref:sigma-70 family RNA polymerase sigma factor n=1 Tax=Micromonospora sp. IBHARD004 TaxID=3457764 RepID=UPI004059AF27
MDDFEAHRRHLHAVAYRMLGSRTEADDAVQEAWVRTARADTGEVRNTRAWLTTVVTRVCLDMLRSRTARREVSLAGPFPLDGSDPEQEAVLADSVGLALLVVMDTLTPAERMALVLHDIFAVPYREIAPIVGRSTDATKMLASRARHRVRAAELPDTDPARQRAAVDAFLVAARKGDFAALLNLLHPDVTVSADGFAAPSPGPTHVRGARAVARQALLFSHRAEHAHTGLVNGAPGILVTPRGRLVTVMTFTISTDRITAIEVIADPQRLGRLSVVGNVFVTSP